MPVQQVLDKFEQRLKRQWRGVFASWKHEAIGNSTRHRLVVGPLYRLDQSSIMLSLTETDGRVHDPASRRDLRGDAELESYLDDFLTSTSLPTSLDTYSELAQEPVQGWLKLDAKATSLDDVAVSLNRKQHEDLAARIEGKQPLQMTLALELLKPVGNFHPYSGVRHYAFFAAGGYLVEITKHARSSDGIEIGVRWVP